MNKQIEEKIKFQEKARELSLKHNFLAIQAATGSGKGLAALKCIEADKSSKKWLIVVPETLQIINLQDDIKKHSMEHLYSKIEDIICYASLHKFEGKELNIWLNECHRLSECKTDISKTIKYEKIIADSATINDDVKERLEMLGDFHYLRLSLKRAIEIGIVPSPTIYIIPVKLDDKLKTNPTKFGKKTVYLSDKAKADNFDKSLSYWAKRLATSPKDLWIGRMFNSIGTERKKFFAKKKHTTIENIIKYLDGKRFVCFAGSTEQADLLGKERAIHSKKGKKHNETTLLKFNNKEIDNIYFFKMGREGMNLADIETVIISQLSTGKDDGLEFLQTSGRAYRSISPEVYIPYCVGTKDEQFLEKALQNIDKQYVKELKL